MSNSNNTNNKNNKTINFAEKKRAIYNKKHQSSEQKNIKNDNKAIKYDLNKMREQINQKTKNSKYDYKYSYLVKYIYLSAILVFSILLIAKIVTSFTDNSTKVSIPNKFVSETYVLSESESSYYKDFVTKYLNTYVKSNGGLDVNTTDIHKNDKYVFVTGYFTYPEEKNKIYFDATMKNKDDMLSLIINGVDITKK